MVKTGAILTAALYVGAAAQAQDGPVIRANTRLVTVDVIVRNSKGPVRGLTTDNFALQDDGKRQEIALFKVTDARAEQEVVPALPTGVVSNRADSRGGAVENTTAILVDHLNTPPDMQMSGDNQVVRFLQTAQPGDRIAVLLLSDGKLQVIQDFTSDLGRLKEVAARLKPDNGKIDSLQQMMDDLAGTPDMPGTPGELLRGLQAMAMQTNVDRAGQTVQALTAIAKHLGGLAGRKNLVWISAGFPLGLGTTPGQSGGLGTCPRCGTVAQFQDQIEQSARFLNEADIAVYPVDPHGVRPDGLAPRVGASRQDTMKVTAKLTGGQTFFQTNDLSGAIRKAIEDGEVTYTLGFYPNEQTLNGKYHELKVKVQVSGTLEKGLDVRFRNGYFASKESVPAAQQVGRAIQEALENPLDATELGIAAKAEADPAGAGGYRVTAWVSLSGLRLEQEAGSWTGELTAAFRAESSKEPTIELLEVPVKLNAAEYQAALEHGFELRRTVATGAKDRVRVVVMDRRSGATGSVWADVGGK